MMLIIIELIIQMTPPVVSFFMSFSINMEVSIADIDLGSSGPNSRKILWMDTLCFLWRISIRMLN